MKLFECNKPAVDPAQLISKLFTDFEDSEMRERSKMISPSGLNCQVSCAFKLSSAPMTPSKESFQSNCFAVNGNDRHRRLQEFLSKTPYWVDVAKYVEKYAPGLEVVPIEDAQDDGLEVMLYSAEYQSRFRCDGILLIEGHYYVLEIKTERQSVNNYRTAASPNHEKQGIAYTLMLNANRILWLYEGRDFLQQKLFVQLVSPKEKAEMDRYMKDILLYMKEPEKLERNTKACTYCAYSNYCKMFFRERKKKALSEKNKQTTGT